MAGSATVGIQRALLCSRRGRMTAYWVWTFSNKRSIEWVVANQRMGFADHAGSRLQDMGPGDRAVLYATGRATGAGSRFVGLATVATTPEPAPPGFGIAGRPFQFHCQVDVELLLDLRAAPLVAENTHRLELIRKPYAYWNYFIPSPKRLTKGDYEAVASLVWAAAEGAGDMD